jgi:hypothetical protein
METAVSGNQGKTGRYEFKSFTDSEIQLIGYSFLEYQAGKLPVLKPAGERYIIYIYKGKIWLMVNFNPYEMLKYVEDKCVTRAFISGSTTESEDTDVFRSPGLGDIEDEHVIKWLEEKGRLNQDLQD